MSTRRKAGRLSLVQMWKLKWKLFAKKGGESTNIFHGTGAPAADDFDLNVHVDLLLHCDRLEIIEHELIQQGEECLQKIELRLRVRDRKHQDPNKNVRSQIRGTIRRTSARCEWH